MDDGAGAGGRFISSTSLYNPSSSINMMESHLFQNSTLRSPLHLNGHCDDVKPGGSGNQSDRHMFLSSDSTDEVSLKAADFHLSVDVGQLNVRSKDSLSFILVYT